jgi:hypothetical protein
MIKLGTRLFVILLFLFLLSQFPGIIDVFVLLFQAVGGYTLALIDQEPIFFAVGFLLIFGLAKAKATS